MLASATTKSWAEFEAKATLHSAIDREDFLPNLKTVAMPNRHIVITGGAAGEEEGIFFDDYYFRVKYKSDLPEEQAGDLVRDLCEEVTPGIISSFMNRQVVAAQIVADGAMETGQDVLDFAGEAGDLAIEINGKIKDRVDKTIDQYDAIIDSGTSILGNLHWIVLGVAAIAIVGGAVYFAPLIMARK